MRIVHQAGDWSVNTYLKSPSIRAAFHIGRIMIGAIRVFCRGVVVIPIAKLVTCLARDLRELLIKTNVVDKNPFAFNELSHGPQTIKLERDHEI